MEFISRLFAKIYFREPSYRREGIDKCFYDFYHNDVIEDIMVFKSNFILPIKENTRHDPNFNHYN